MINEVKLMSAHEKARKIRIYGEVLKLHARGYGNVTIARQTGLGTKEVENFLSDIRDEEMRRVIIIWKIIIDPGSDMIAPGLIFH